MSGFCSVYNKTENTVVVTLYIRDRNNLGSFFGTRVITLQSGDRQDVDYGDIYNAYLSGIQISMVNNGTSMEFKKEVKAIDDTVDKWLNSGRLFEILNIGIPEIRVYKQL